MCAAVYLKIENLWVKYICIVIREMIKLNFFWNFLHICKEHAIQVYFIQNLVQSLSEQMEEKFQQKIKKNLKIFLHFAIFNSLEFVCLFPSWVNVMKVFVGICAELFSLLSSDQLNNWQVNSNWFRQTGTWMYEYRMDTRCNLPGQQTN